MDSLAVAESEDSSYDSECDGDSSHEQVSRTTSDTLGQEFAEYVSQPQSITKKIDSSASYTQRVEFALKLGYTEKLVQAALARLGSDPAQNELLAELIKLGAQHGNKSDLCDQHNSLPNGTDATGINTINSVNSNNGKNEPAAHTGLRPIVIDGSNVAYCHGNKEVFSCLGIRLCVEWFKNRGHQEITVFVPKFRGKENPRPDNPIKDQELLSELEKERMLVYTPSRSVGGKRTVCYDDRYILKLAAESDGVVVSNDNYRDLANENMEFKKVVEERLLMYSFVADRFMPPDDPLGRSGPTLENFLRRQPKYDPQPQCPYGKKCTYGNKCKFYHPERGMGPHKSVTERLLEHAAKHLSARNSDGNEKAVCGKSLSVPLSSNTTEMNDRRKPLARTRSCAHDGCTPLNCHESIHKQRTLNPNKQSFGNTLNPDDHNDITTVFSESCKLLAPELHSGQVQQSPIGNPHHMYAAGPSATIHSSQSPQSQSIRPIIHYSNCNVLTSTTSTGSNQSTMHEKRNDVNMHQKLQRQLSLNPDAYDPRLLRMYNANSIQTKHSHASQMHQESSQVMSGHRQLAPSHSGPRSHMGTNHWDLHQNVTRIASAPDSTRTWQNNVQPQISPNDIMPTWSHSMTVPQTAQSSNSTQANRLHIQYHLSSIFPEDQVLTAMNMYPNETNPQQICAAILTMFPRN